MLYSFIPRDSPRGARDTDGNVRYFLRHWLVPLVSACYSTHMLTFFLKLLIRIAGNSAAVYIADLYIDGFTFTGNWFMLATTGFLLAAGNIFLKPLLKVLAFPLVFLTFGLFNVVINMLILWGVDILMPSLSIDGLLPLLWGTFVLSMVNMVFSIF